MGHPSESVAVQGIQLKGGDLGLVAEATIGSWWAEQCELVVGHEGHGDHGCYRGAWAMAAWTAADVAALRV